MHDPADPDIAGLQGIKPMRLFTSDDDEPVERDTLFYIDDKPFTIPVRVGVDVAIEYLHRAAAVGGGGEGEALAADYLLTEMLGEEGYRALRTYKKLTAAQFAHVIAVCTRIAVRVARDPKSVRDRLVEVAWVLDHLDDLASDFSAIHRITDMSRLTGEAFFKLAFRMSAYQSVMQARVLERHAESERRPICAQRAAGSHAQAAGGTGGARDQGRIAGRSGDGRNLLLRITTASRAGR